MEARNHGIPQLRSDVQHVRRVAHQWPSTILATALPPPLTKSLAASKSMESREPERKRPRTTFTNQQLVELELEFHIDRFLNRIRCITIAKRLAISEKKVKIWFQNRRTKYKKNALKAKDIRGVHQPAIESTSNTPIASGSITQGFLEKTTSLPLATDWPPQKKITTFADIQRAFQEFREYAKKVRELHASNQQSSSMSVEATPVKLENAAFTFKENSTTNTQPAPPPCSPSELGNNSCDDIDLSFLDHCPAPDLMAWNYSLISQDTSSGLPPFDMDLDCLNKLLNC